MGKAIANPLNAQLEDWIANRFNRAEWLAQFKSAVSYLSRLRVSVSSGKELLPIHITQISLKNGEIAAGDLNAFYRWMWSTPDNGIANIERAALPPDALEDILKHVDCQGITFAGLNALILKDPLNYAVVHQWLAGWKLRNIGYDWAKLPKACLHRFFIGTRPDLFANIPTEEHVRELCDLHGVTYSMDTTWPELNQRLSKLAPPVESNDPEYTLKRSIAFWEIF